MIVGSVRNINTQSVYVDKDAPQCNSSSRSRGRAVPGNVSVRGDGAVLALG